MKTIRRLIILLVVIALGVLALYKIDSLRVVDGDKLFSDSDITAEEPEQTIEESEPIVEFEPETASPINKYQELIDANSNLNSWITIDSLGISYPVIYTPEDYDAYLRKDLYGHYSYHGTLFSDVDINSNRVIIYGHNMTDGTMFGSLDKYLDKEFADENRIFQVSDLEEDYNYEVAAVCLDWVHNKDEDCFKYYNFSSSGASIQDLQDWIDLRASVKYNTEITEDDYILMLSTCSYYRKNGRLVVVAVRK